MKFHKVLIKNQIQDESGITRYTNDSDIPNETFVVSVGGMYTHVWNKIATNQYQCLGYFLQNDLEWKNFNAMGGVYDFKGIGGEARRVYNLNSFGELNITLEFTAKKRIPKFS
jgi:hypothetical protein